jgi:hypothetical protein
LRERTQAQHAQRCRVASSRAAAPSAVKCAGARAVAGGSMQARASSCVGQREELRCQRWATPSVAITELAQPCRNARTACRAAEERG